MSTTILFSAFPPFPTLSLAVADSTPLAHLPELLHERYPDLPASADLTLSTHSGALLALSTPVSVLRGDNDNDMKGLLSLRLAPRLRGGKGGFGSQLRAAGGRMSSQKTSNNDSCRDLSGRRLSTIKEAKRLAEYLESEPERKKAAAEAQKAKLEALEKKLALNDSSKGGAGASSSKTGEPEVLAGKKHRFDDTEYLEQSRDLVDGAKNAVAIGLLKKKKKAKTSHPSSTATGAVAAASSAAEKVVASPASAPVVAATSAAIGIASA